MVKVDLEHARQNLLQQRTQLLQKRGDQLTEESRLLEGRESDWIDQASDQWDATLLDRFSNAELRRLKLINAALGRIEEGGYGYCIRCGDVISNQRLEAMPETPYCLDCSDELTELARRMGAMEGRRP